MTVTKNPLRPSAHFIRRMRHWRKERGLSLSELVARLDELGWPIARTTLGEMEAGKRHVKLDDFLAISAALNVAPAAMLLPLSDGPDETAVAAELALPPWAMVRWVAGDMPLIDKTGNPISYKQWSPSVTPLTLMRRQHELASNVTRLLNLIAEHPDSETDDDRAGGERHERLGAEVDELARHLKFMLDAGVPPLPISRDIFDALTAAGTFASPHDYERIDRSRLTVTGGPDNDAESATTGATPVNEA